MAKKYKITCSVTHKILMCWVLEIETLSISLIDFKVGCRQVAIFMKRNNFLLKRRTSLYQRLPKDCMDKTICFEWYISQSCHKKHYGLSQIRRADQTLIFQYASEQI